MKRVLILIFLFIFSFSYGKVIVPVSKTKFKVLDDNGNLIKEVDLKGQEFIVVSVREPGSDGRFYAVDRDGVVWWTGVITSGADDYKTPSGIYTVLRKKRYHMSSAYPEENGVNNMDFSIFFTNRGHALHMGSINWMSHGCIHIAPKDIPVIYHWAKVGDTKIVITRKSYMPFAKDDLILFGFR
ncbi:MAG: L,D-transpeptidase [Epsilonproteobacteria bacterium]|nr:L,D-transpeptidase [Campylobacterota bacterium]